MRLTIEGKWLLGGIVLLGLSSCAMPQGWQGRGPVAGVSLPASPPPAEMVSDLPVKIGQPYSVGGVLYTPADDPTYDEVGYASWYGEELSGGVTANGEAFNPAGISAAHRTLPLPSYVEVTSLDSGRTILVRVNDRGPFSNDRLIDLSRGAAEQLGISGDGAAAVRVRRVNPPEQERVKLRAGQRAAARIDAPDALLSALRKQVKGRDGEAPRDTGSSGPRLDYALPDEIGPDKIGAREQAVPPSSTGYVVQLAAFSSRSRADKAARRVGGYLSERDDVWRVRLGPYGDGAAARRGVEQAAASGFNGARIVVND